MYIIIVGAGNIGSSLIDLATKDPNNVVAIEIDRKVATAISRKYDVEVINADGASAEVLMEAGANRADALVATTRDDATNLMVTSLGKEIGVPSLVSVVNNPKHSGLFRKMGTNVMQNPEEIVAEYLYNSVKRPEIQDFITLTGGARIFKLTVSQESPIANKSLREAGGKILPESTLVIAIERSGELIVPSGDTVILKGDLLTIFSKEWTPSKTLEKITG